MRCSSTKQSLHPARISSCNNHTVMMLTWERMCLHQDRPAPGVRWGAGRASSSGGCGTCDTGHTAPDSLSAPCQQTACHITKSRTFIHRFICLLLYMYVSSFLYAFPCNHFFFPSFYPAHIDSHFTHHLSPIVHAMIVHSLHMYLGLSLSTLYQS